MKITRIIGENGQQAALCNGNACPAFIETDDGHVLVQGARLNESERNQLTAPAHEDFVKIPVATLQRIVAQF
jgi:hypothetical protein